MMKSIDDTCAWTPNRVSVATARNLLQSWWARLSTGASREAPVDNECFSPWRGAHLSTGASREAPVDNECFNLLCFSLLCVALHCIIGRRARLSPGVSCEAPVDNECFSTILTTSNPGIQAIGILEYRLLGRVPRLRYPGDEQSWNTGY